MVDADRVFIIKIYRPFCVRKVWSDHKKYKGHD